MICQQLIISGVGGQGILFITRLLAETAIAKGLPVLTSETHGMAQRGGIVISHLKIGDFSSPLVRPGQADGLIALKPGNVQLHRSFLKPEGWIAANSGAALSLPEAPGAATVDADRISLQLGNPQAVNLIVLGRALAAGRLFCTPDELEGVMRKKLHKKAALLAGALAALSAGRQAS
ncbi:MAG: indolepyruvate oxidoreductase [Geobacteraceae bacterium GWC2_58_44]|nr:MAG: indolepyruvate oxidoreductase [Geobacteraceae bacterium GWC2_58_44]HBG05137.1 indolepyruvate oxidoreductase subunit beta [Geobacter sp.]